MYLIFHGPLFFPLRNVPPYCRPERNTVNKAHSTAEHNKAICSAQAAFGIIKSMFAPNLGLFFLPPSHFFFLVALFALRERGGRRQPPTERSPCKYEYIFQTRDHFVEWRPSTWPRGAAQAR